MRARTIVGPAAVWLAAAAQALGQLPGQTARPPDARPARQELPPPYVTRQSDVEIPFSVKPGDSPASQPTAVRVFVSWDRGKTWHFYDERKPEDGKFRFQPRQDGEFWFATQTVDRSGKTDSPEPRHPQLRLLIDTQKPQLLAQPSVVRAGEVTLAWSAADASLAASTLKIEYQDAAGSGGPWQSVAVHPSAVQTANGQMTGRAVFEPKITGRSINLRAEVADAAGNVSYYSQQVSLSLPRTAIAGSPAPAPPPDRTATRWPSANQPSGIQPSENPFTEPGPALPGEPLEPAVKIPQVVDNPHARQDRLVSSRSSPVPIEQLPPPTAQPLPIGEALPPPGIGGRDPGARDQEPGASSREGEPREGEAPAEPLRSMPLQTESIAPPQGSRPRLTASRRFSLDYDVETVGPEGLADVELWGTNDGGHTWAKWGSDPDKQSPMDVEVNGEALYGFRVVIVGKSGLASNAPRAGDAADIWVGIDLTRPKARLVSAAYGQGNAAGKLDIRWEAADANLASRPVTILISDQPDGAFTPIAAGLPNSGQYYWDFDPRSPRLIYLRLEVRDDAGNVAVDQLTEPIKVDGLQPKGRIRGFNVP
jgi:hypothetical protein